MCVVCVCVRVCVSARACDSDGVEEDDEKKTIKFPFFSIILRLRTTFGLSGLFFFVCDKRRTDGSHFSHSIITIAFLLVLLYIYYC